MIKLFFVFFIGLTSILSSCNSSEGKKDSKTTLSTLKEGYVTFAVPITASGNPWEGGDILNIDLTISLKNGKQYSAHGEHRNQPIGPGNAVYVNIDYSRLPIKDILKDEIVEIDIHLKAFPGQGTPTLHKTIFRAESVMIFDDGTLLATGYNEPASGLVTGSIGDGFHIIKNGDRDHFFDKVTLVKPFN